MRATRWVDTDHPRRPDGQFAPAPTARPAGTVTPAVLDAPFTVGSLFSGIGGMDLGLHRAGGTILWACEIDENAASIFRRHWPTVPVYPDVRKLSVDQLRADGHPIPDVIAAGSPCQDLSLAGRRAGLLKGERSNLFFDFVRLLRECQPKAFVWENVPGVFSLNDGNDFRIAVDSFARAGYAIDLDVLDSRMFGVAQRRRRVFAVGVRPDVLLTVPSGWVYATQALAEIATAVIAEHRPTWVTDAPAWASGEGIARRVGLFNGLSALIEPVASTDENFNWTETGEHLARVAAPLAARAACLTAAADFDRAWLLSEHTWNEALRVAHWATSTGFAVPFVPLVADIVNYMTSVSADTGNGTPPAALVKLVERVRASCDGWQISELDEPAVAETAKAVMRAETLLQEGSGPGAAQAQRTSSISGELCRAYVAEAFSSLFGPLEHRGVWDDALAVADSSDTADHRVA